MDSQQRPSKTLEDSPIYEKSKEKIQPNARRFDDAVNAVTFAIANKPSDFPIDRETGIQIAKTIEANDVPALTIYFKEQDNKIILLDVETTKDGDSIE